MSIGPLQADQVDEYLRAQMVERQIPGIAVKVLQDGKVTKSAVYGLADLEHQVAVREETVFEIGSITKQFTAAGILLLAQDGKLSVDDKISQHLGPIPETWKDINIRHLLMHSSGIKNYTGLTGFELTRRLTQQHFIAEIGRQPLEFQPGTAWAYCNSGYNLLGYIIENVSRTNYWDFLGERIFRRLGMTATTDRNPATIILHRARGYEQAKGIRVNRDYDLTDVFAAGAIVSTTGDLAKWSAALDGEALLTAASKADMWTPAEITRSRSAQYGLGWYLDVVEGHKNVGHGGSTSGFSASFQRFPDDRLAVILLTNTGEQVATRMAKHIATFYFQKK